MTFLSKYGVARHIYIPMVKRAVVDHAVSADWTPSAGDVKISKTGGAAANVTNLPVAIAMGNSTIWDFSLTATEMQSAQIMVTIGDSATKAVEDSAFIIETYGNASAQHAVDLADSVRAGLTALPNAAAEAAGGLYTRGSGAGQINQPANGQIDANAVKMSGTALTARDVGLSVLISSGSGTGQLDVTSGVIKANLAQILATALTETAGQLAGGFKKLFDVTTPVFTLLSINQTGDAYGRLGAPAGASVSADVAAVKALLPTALVGGRMDSSLGAIAVGVDLSATMKTSVTTAATAATPTAAAVTGAVGSVTGNVGGNVVGSVASVTAGVTLAASAVQAIWDALTSALTTVGSIGKLLVTNIDAAISSRLASGSYTAPDNTSITAIKAKTDSLTFTKPGEIDANIQSVNDTTVTGAGTSGSPWGP